MMLAGREAIGDGVAEYEVAIATSNAGTKKAAEILKNDYQDKFMSPNTHFLQIMASGDTITKTHHRASTRVMRSGEPELVIKGITPALGYFALNTLLRLLVPVHHALATLSTGTVVPSQRVVSLPPGSASKKSGSK